MFWLASKGAHVAIPLGHSPHYDLVADWDGRLLRVQVKTSTFRRKGRWDAMLCTRGGNQGWNGLSKHIDPSKCDFVFVLVGDGRQWFIPSGALGGTSKIRLGGPKYAEFEVEPGEPLPYPTREEQPLHSAPPDARGDVRVVKGDGL